MMYDLSNNYSYNHNNSNYFLKTDVLDCNDHYEMEVEVPNVNKNDIGITLEDGFININVNVNENINSKYLRRERFKGQYSRSFYVGYDITNDDIKAHLEDGILKLSISKKENKKMIKVEWGNKNETIV